MTSFPTVCCSFSAHPGRGGVISHNAAYRALGLDYTYVAFGVTDIGEAVRAVRALGIRGAGVSMPFKLTVLPLLDHLDPVAAQIRSVNTIVNDAGVLTGYNTDWSGARRALEEVTTLAGKRAALVGAGGVARAIAYMLAREGASVHVFNRSLERAQALATEYQLDGAHPLAALTSLGDYDLLVNATSVGMGTTGESIVPAALLHAGLVVFDVVADPAETTLIAHARAAGATCVPGTRLRLFQAVEQFRLYTGQDAPLDVMENARRR